MKVVLFCGGLGMRMREGAGSAPKPMNMIGDRPLLLLGALLIVVGIQLLTFGLMSQMFVAMRPEQSAVRTNVAQVERVLGGGPPRTP